MDEALVQYAQHDIDGDQRREDQHWLVAQRSLKRLRRALKAAANGGGQAQVVLDLLDTLDRVAERHAGRKIERDRHRGEEA